jgi:hypothetical protein
MIMNTPYPTYRTPSNAEFKDMERRAETAEARATELAVKNAELRSKNEEIEESHKFIVKVMNLRWNTEWRTRLLNPNNTLTRLDALGIVQYVDTVMADRLRLEEALQSFLQNPHCATTVAEGKHAASGFCSTCSDQYFAGQNALTQQYFAKAVEPAEK